MAQSTKRKKLFCGGGEEGTKQATAWYKSAASKTENGKERGTSQIGRSR